MISFKTYCLLTRFSQIDRHSASDRPLPQLIQLLWPRNEDDVTRGSVDLHMANVVDFARLIRTASDFAFVGHIACKAASKQVSLASNPNNTIDAVVISNIKTELGRIYAKSGQLVQTALVLRKAIGEVCFCKGDSLSYNATDNITLH